MSIVNDESVPLSDKLLKKMFAVSFVFLVSVMFCVVDYSNVDALGKGEEVSLEQQRYVRCQLRENISKPGNKFTLKENKECKKEAIYGEEVLKRTQHLKFILAGHPMEKMAESLGKIDPKVAAFIVGIGKQESNWGKRSPWKNGKDCYNYWGYKTSGSRGKALGHACFGSPEEAVKTIAKRINHFVYDTGRDTPQKLLVWKCGRSCASHNPAGVARWVSTVRIYSQKVLADPTPKERQSKIIAMKIKK